MTVAVSSKDRVAKCRKILDVDPTSQIFAALAEAHRKQGELERAFEVCQTGLRIHPSYGAAHAVMAKISIDRGMYDWAEAEVNKAIELEGQSRATELLQAEIHLYKKEFAEATRLLKKLYQLDPHNHHVKKLLDIAQNIPKEIMAVATREKSIKENLEQPPYVATEQAASEGPRVLGHAELLNEIISISGITVAMLLRSDGLIEETKWSTGVERSEYGNTLSELKNDLSNDVMKASFGKLNTVLVETGKNVLYMTRLSDRVLALIGDENTNLGALRMKVAGLIEMYQPGQAG